MSSQFEGLFNAVKDKKASAANEEKPKKRVAKKASPDPPPVVEKSEIPASAKSRNSDFEQTLVYLKKETKKEVKRSLLDDAANRNFSDLVEDLLSDWLHRRT